VRVRKAPHGRITRAGLQQSEETASSRGALRSRSGGKKVTREAAALPQRLATAADPWRCMVRIVVTCQMHKHITWRGGAPGTDGGRVQSDLAPKKACIRHIACLFERVLSIFAQSLVGARGRLEDRAHLAQLHGRR